MKRVKKRCICLFLSIFLIVLSSFSSYQRAYATGLDAVVGWESTLVGATSTLLLPFGQVDDKTEELMQEFISWQEKAENGIVSKVSIVWEALKEFVVFVKNSVGFGDTLVNKNVSLIGDNAFVSSDSVVEYMGQQHN